MFGLLYVYRNQGISIIVMYYKRNIWNAQRTALIPVNELLGTYTASIILYNITQVRNLLWRTQGAEKTGIFGVVFLKFNKLYNSI